MSRKVHKFDLYTEDDDDAGSRTEDSVHYDDPETESVPSSPVTPPTHRSQASHRPPRPASRHFDSAHEKERHRRKVAAPSLDMVDSLSTIPSDPVDKAEDVRDVYNELQHINDKLKREFKVLHQRDVILKQKEKSLSDLQMSLDTAIDNEVKRRLATKEQNHKTEMRKLEESLKDKTRENRRLKENFESLKNANDILRKELDTLTHSQEKMQKQYQSVQARLINLQRRKETEDKKPENASDALPADLAHRVRLGLMAAKEKVPPASKKSKTSVSSQEVLGSLLDWVCECQLRQTATELPTKLVHNETARELIEDRCFKLLPSMVELVREQTTSSSRITLPLLQFVYWSLVHLEGSQSQHLRTSISTTLRRLGVDLYRGQASANKTSEDDSTEPPEKHRDSLFFKSTHLHTRLLSSLIILKTISQVDYLAQVYDVLRNDLKSDNGKEFFLFYQGTPIMLTHLKPTNKALTNSSLDVYLQMSMDSPYLRSFLDSCSRESWFQAVSLIWRMPGIEAKQHEKISIILQKLSKIRLNKKYFEVFGLTASCQELQRSATVLSPFLSLNLKSILFNLTGAGKTQTKPSS